MNIQSWNKEKEISCQKLLNKIILVLTCRYGSVLATMFFYKSDEYHVTIVGLEEATRLRNKFSNKSK